MGQAAGDLGQAAPRRRAAGTCQWELKNASSACARRKTRSHHVGRQLLLPGERLSLRVSIRFYRYSEAEMVWHSDCSH